jgi:hypothetical protein
MTRTLTERRKADREIMAQQVFDMAFDLGASAAMILPGFNPREICVHIETPQGLRLSVNFNGKSPQRKPDTYVLSWHMGHDATAKLAPAFGDVNPHHWRKSTDVVHGYAALLELLRRRLGQVLDGTAFQPEAAI